MTENTLEIGKYIKKARTDKGMTIKELSERTGITSSMLSQIERDLANPSINTLKTISGELEVPMYKFFQSEEQESEQYVVRKENRKTIGNLATNMSYDLLTPNTRGSIEFCLVTLSPWRGEKIVSSSHKGEETALILSGKTDIYINDEKYTLNEGDSIIIPPMAKHYWCNSYESICQAVFAITPPSF